jgi:hypothetical protein
MSFTGTELAFRSLRVALILMTAVATSGAIAADGRTEPAAPAAVRDAYSSGIAEKYNYRYGKSHPFLPSNIQTNNGQFLDPKNFPTAQYCGHCH